MHAPVLLTKVRPGGVTSATLTPDTSCGPSFVTVNAYAMVVPGVTLDGPVFVILRSAASPTGTAPPNSDVFSVLP